MKKLERKFLLSLAVGLMPYITSAHAINCVPSPDCANLGYNQTEADCEGLDVIKCPSDVNKVFCKAQKNTKKCDTVGDVLYGDGTCSSSSANIVSNLTPIGVVFDTKYHLAIALTDVKKDGSAGSEDLKWLNINCSISQERCTYTTNEVECRIDGRYNTDQIFARSCGGTSSAANATNKYEAIGCLSDFCKKGKWFLPSLRDLKNIYDGKNNINATLSLLSNQGAENLTEGNYWSSNQQSYYNAWRFSMTSGNTGDSHKHFEMSVRPVVQY